jgi:hypothetical protein
MGTVISISDGEAKFLRRIQHHEASRRAHRDPRGKMSKGFRYRAGLILSLDGDGGEFGVAKVKPHCAG